MELRYNAEHAAETKKIKEEIAHKPLWHNLLCVPMTIILFAYIYFALTFMWNRATPLLLVVGVFIGFGIVVVLTMMSFILAFDREDVNYDFPEFFYMETSEKTLLEVFLDDPYSVCHQLFFHVNVVTIDAKNNISRSPVGSVRLVEREEDIPSPILDVNAGSVIVPYKKRTLGLTYPVNELSLHWEHPETDT